MPKHSFQILELARRGAEARITELEAEIAELRKIAAEAVDLESAADRAVRAVRRLRKGAA